MKIYKDRSLTNQIVDNTFDLGIVPVGETKYFKFWVLNETSAVLRELNFVVDHTEVKVTKSPKELGIDEVGELIFEWTPSVTLKEGLRARVRVTGVSLYYPPK